jgi:hypothetical protein
MTTKIKSPCCDERVCQREQPIKLWREAAKDGQPARWFAATQYIDHGPGAAIEPLQRHQLGQEDTWLLELGWQAFAEKAAAEQAKQAPAAPRKPSSNPQLNIDHLSGEHLSPVAGCPRCSAEARP